MSDLIIGGILIICIAAAVKNCIKKAKSGCSCGCANCNGCSDKTE